MVKLSSLALSSDIIYLSHYATYRNMMMAAGFFGLMFGMMVMISMSMGKSECLLGLRVCRKGVTGLDCTRLRRSDVPCLTIRKGTRTVRVGCDPPHLELLGVTRVEQACDNSRFYLIL